MPAEITMPKLSDTMTEGRFGAWRKQVGDRVERGEIIAEVETDKAVMELEAFASGILLEQRATGGEVIAVGAVIGLIGMPGETAGESAPEHGVAAQPTLATPVIVPEQSQDAPAEAAGEGGSLAEEHLQGQAGPVVRRRARELGIDLTDIAGSGPGGRVLLEDLEQYSGVSFAHAAPAVSPPPPDTQSAPAVPDMPPGIQVSAPDEQPAPLSKMRAAIARTVAESWSSIPHFSLTADVAMDNAEELRRELKLGGIKATVNDLVIKATAMALAAYPQLNSRFTDDGVIVKREVNIGLAVAVPDGLLVPVLRGCQGISLLEVVARTPALIARARAGQLASTELLGATFTVSNLGRYDIESFAAVIHPEQAAILAVGALREAVVPRGGVPVVARMMKLTLAADHRSIDGAYAASFLREVKAILETPVRMLV